VTNYFTNFLCDILILRYRLNVIIKRGGVLYIYCIWARSGNQNCEFRWCEKFMFWKIIMTKFLDLANDVIFLWNLTRGPYALQFPRIFSKGIQSMPWFRSKQVFIHKIPKKFQKTVLIFTYEIFGMHWFLVNSNSLKLE